MHTRKHINYADLNTGIDSELDKSLPWKKERSIAELLRGLSMTVIATHQQCVTRQGLQKMFPSPPHKTPKLVGTAIISPPAKDIKSENDTGQAQLIQTRLI